MHDRLMAMLIGVDERVPGPSRRVTRDHCARGEARGVERRTVDSERLTAGQLDGGALFALHLRNHPDGVSRNESFLEVEIYSQRRGWCTRKALRALRAGQENGDSDDHDERDAPGRDGPFRRT